MARQHVEKGDENMKSILKSILLGLLMCAFCAAQDTTAPASSAGTQTQQEPARAQAGQANQQPANSPRRIAAGSVIPVQLTKTIDAKKIKTGDPVEAKVTADLKSNNGEVIVSKDTKVIGHVTEAQARNKEQKESQIGIEFDRAESKNGPEMQMPMSIQAIIAPPSMNLGADNGPTSSPTPGGSGMAAGGRSPGMSGSTSTPPNPNPQTTGGDMTASNGQAGNSGRPPITAETKGVVGISDLTLSAAPNASDGSVVTSDKNNVKLESGTLMLLRVGQ
jgi:hypothetical protein